MSKMSKAGAPGGTGTGTGTGRGLVGLLGGSNISNALIPPPVLLSILAVLRLREMSPSRTAAETVSTLAAFPIAAPLKDPQNRASDTEDGSSETGSALQAVAAAVAVMTLLGGSLDGTLRVEGISKMSKVLGPTVALLAATESTGGNRVASLSLSAEFLITS